MALEGLALVVFGVLELVHLDSDRVVLAVTTALFFVALGAGLLRVRLRAGRRALVGAGTRWSPRS